MNCAHCGRGLAAGHRHTGACPDQAIIGAEYCCACAGCADGDDIVTAIRPPPEPPAAFAPLRHGTPIEEVRAAARWGLDRSQSDMMIRATWFGGLAVRLMGERRGVHVHVNVFSQGASLGTLTLRIEEWEELEREARALGEPMPPLTTRKP